jgi:hypothetical protein
MWSLTSQRERRTSGPEKFQSSVKKDFFNTIGCNTGSRGQTVKMTRMTPTRTWPGNFAVTHKTLPFGDVLECLLDLREDL